MSMSPQPGKVTRGKVTRVFSSWEAEPSCIVGYNIEKTDVRGACAGAVSGTRLDDDTKPVSCSITTCLRGGPVLIEFAYPSMPGWLAGWWRSRTFKSGGLTIRSDRDSFNDMRGFRVYSISVPGGDWAAFGAGFVSERLIADAERSAPGRRRLHYKYLADIIKDVYISYVLDEMVNGDRG